MRRVYCKKATVNKSSWVLGHGNLIGSLWSIACQRQVCKANAALLVMMSLIFPNIRLKRSHREARDFCDVPQKPTLSCLIHQVPNIVLQKLLSQALLGVRFSRKKVEAWVQSYRRFGANHRSLFRTGRSTAGRLQERKGQCCFPPSEPFSLARQQKWRSCKMVPINKNAPAPGNGSLTHL